MERQNNIRERFQLYCEEGERLRDRFMAAIREVVDLQKQQTKAVIEYNDDFIRFDDLIHMARLAKDNAKYALLAHLAKHQCHGLSRPTEKYQRKNNMRPLTEEERARISDGKQNIQAASEALSGVDGSVIPHLKAIEECLAEADTSLHKVLRSP